MSSASSDEPLCTVNPFDWLLLTLSRSCDTRQMETLRDAICLEGTKFERDFMMKDRIGSRDMWNGCGKAAKDGSIP